MLGFGWRSIYIYIYIEKAREKGPRCMSDFMPVSRNHIDLSSFIEFTEHREEI